MSSVWSEDKGLYDFVELSRCSDFVVVLVGMKRSQVEMLKGGRAKVLLPLFTIRDQGGDQRTSLMLLARRLALTRRGSQGECTRIQTAF